ncbi:hypothetical protein [Actinacidiphila sp. ITFR-21]|uniref:hypothetical protein n=1 Tax=Actinacidiphila sp. ITFR-21 TaxID=3075199 RepID=UPI00288BA8F6|nr:hypothetical protein [Streptomyces sp. ITFR-21]WNI20280.1 hypothetical protein RLT57_32965 [Streptomyces sp. ITFR-21]
MATEPGPEFGVFFTSPDGTSLMRSLGVLPPPEGWIPISAEEFNAAMAEHHPEQGPINMLGVKPAGETPAKAAAKQ